MRMLILLSVILCAACSNKPIRADVDASLHTPHKDAGVETVQPKRYDFSDLTDEEDSSHQELQDMNVPNAEAGC